MNTREKLLVIAVILLVLANGYDNHQIGELRETVHQQKIALLKACIQEYSVNSCNY